jgi:DNA-binding response OmpR family regulator
MAKICVSGDGVIARFGAVTFDSARRQVMREKGEPLHLTPKAFDPLALLIDEAPSTETTERGASSTSGADPAARGPRNQT